MNRINPLYIGLVLVLILLLSMMNLNSAKIELQETKEDYVRTSKLAVELSELKKTYANQKNLQNALRRILNQPSLKSAGVVVKYKKSNAKMSAESLDKKSLDFLMGKILNSTFNIVSFDVKKLSEEKASFKMEIKW